jgi:hypothetical protein
MPLTGRLQRMGRGLTPFKGRRRGDTEAAAPRRPHPGWYLVPLPVIALVVISVLAYRSL